MKNVYTINDPINMVILACEQAFPSVEAVVQYDHALEDQGETWAIAAGEDDTTVILLNPTIAVAEAASALAEALTACYVGAHVPHEDDEYRVALGEIVAVYQTINDRGAWVN